jgi:hypothetical protein
MVIRSTPASPQGHGFRCLVVFGFLSGFRLRTIPESSPKCTSSAMINTG